MKTEETLDFLLLWENKAHERQQPQIWALQVVSITEPASNRDSKISPCLQMGEETLSAFP